MCRNTDFDMNRNGTARRRGCLPQASEKKLMHKMTKIKENRDDFLLN